MQTKRQAHQTKSPHWLAYHKYGAFSHLVSTDDKSEAGPTQQPEHPVPVSASRSETSRKKKRNQK